VQVLLAVWKQTLRSLGGLLIATLNAASEAFRTGIGDACVLDAALLTASTYEKSAPVLLEIALDVAHQQQEAVCLCRGKQCTYTQCSYGCPSSFSCAAGGPMQDWEWLT